VAHFDSSTTPAQFGHGTYSTFCESLIAASSAIAGIGLRVHMLLLLLLLLLPLLLQLQLPLTLQLQLPLPLTLQLQLLLTLQLLLLLLLNEYFCFLVRMALLHDSEALY
jgi:hypothetical protein